MFHAFTIPFTFSIMKKIHRRDDSMAAENVKRGMVCATIGALSWGLSGTCGQYLFMHYTIDALLLTNIRMLGAGIVLMILVISLQRHTLTALLHNRRDMAQLAAFSVLGLVTCQLTYLSAIQYANSGTATVLQSLNVALMSCIAAIRFRRWPDRWQMIAIFLALAGVFLIATGGQIQTMVISPQGLFWGIGAAIGSILYTVLPHKQIRKWGTLPVNALGMLIGGIVLTICLRPWQIAMNLDTAGIFAIAFIVLIGTVASFTLFLRGVGDIGPVKATFIGTLEPVSATLSSLLFLGTPFSFTDFVGFACIIATVYLITMKSQT